MANYSFFYLYREERELLCDCHNLAVDLCREWGIEKIPLITFDERIAGPKYEIHNNTMGWYRPPGTIWLRLTQYYKYGGNYFFGSLRHELAHHIEMTLYGTIGHGEEFFAICKKVGGYIESREAGEYATNPYKSGGALG